MNHKLLFYLLLPGLVTTSCVYFNTFYNAETSYEKALIIIEESPITTEDKLPSQAGKLLGEAIENSKLVIENYPDSKFIDDAVFIIGRASFLRDEVAIAEKYFKMILELYPESRFYQLTEIWLAYTYFRMGLIDSAQTDLNKIQARNPNDKKQLFIIHNLLAEISMETNNLEQVYYHYNLAADYAGSNSKKTATYGKLVKIAEHEGDKIRASIYLEELGKVAPNNLRIESKMQLITYQRELGEYDKIINEIGSLLGLSEFKSKYIKLELELGKVYLDKRDFPMAKEIFSQLVEIYSKKDETSEAYFYLGDIALIEEFNLDLAKEYFEKSKTEKSQSKYGKKSKNILGKITRLENLEKLYKEVIKNTDKETNFNQFDSGEKSENTEGNINIIKDGLNKDELLSEEVILSNTKFWNSRDTMDFDINRILEGEDIKGEEKIELSSETPDSILFMVGEMLLYDFNHLERALDKFKTLAEEFPKSKFSPQALYVLSHFEPDGVWYDRLKVDFPNSLFFLMDSSANTNVIKTRIESYRDYAWSLAQQSYEDSYLEFNRLFNEEKDTLSAYILGFISDIYLNNIERSILHYQSFVDNYPDHNYADIADNRLKEIKSNLEEIKETSQQGIDYQFAVKYLYRESDFDSVKVLLSEISAGLSSPYKNSANSIKDAIRDYEKLLEDIKIQDGHVVDENTNTDIRISEYPVEIDQDSILYQLAYLFQHELLLIDSARFYHVSLVESFRNSKYRARSLIYLSEIEPDAGWEDMLITDYPDTTFIPEKTIYQSIYTSDIFEEGFSDMMLSKISDCEKYLGLFPAPMDTSLILPDSSFDKNDTMGIQKDSVTVQENLDIMQPDHSGEKGEIKP